jgi:predicted porin
MLEIIVKKTCLCLAVVATIPQLAVAQNSVTLYGMLDSGLTYVNNTGKGAVVYADTCGPLGCNRWGLTGKENLGGGTSAIFTLENGFNLQNGKLGQGGTMFGRQAFVGLTNDHYGTLTLGRQYDSLSDTVGMFPSSNNFALGYGSHFGDLDNLNQSIRINNTVKYVSPSWSGLQLDSMYSFGGQPGSFSTDSSWAVAASYTNGPFAMAAGYLDIRNPATRSDGTGGVYASNGNYTGSLGQYVGLQDADSMKVFSAGGSYAIGKASIGLVYSHTSLKNSQYFVVNNFAGAGTGSDFTLDSYELTTTYQVSPAFSVGAAYIYNVGKADYQGLKPTFQQVNLGASYALSKRTSFYGAAIYQKAGGDGIAPVIGADGTVVGRTAIAEIPGTGIDSSTNKQVLVTIGVSHKF